MITLAEAKVGMADKVDQQVIDEFRRGSLLLDMLVFDDAVSPGTGGSTLTYGYMKLKTPSTASFRNINEEYANNSKASNEAKKEKASADLKIFGGEFSIDRVIAESSGAVDEVDFQLKEKIKGAINLFHYTVINGDSNTNGEEFDGLDVLLTGSDTERNTDVYELTSDTDVVKGKNYYTRTGAGTDASPYIYTLVETPAKANIATYYENISEIDLSDSEKMDANYKVFLDEMDAFVGKMQGKPSILLMNSVMKTKMKGIARRAGYYSRTEDSFGQGVDNWDNIPMLDMEEYFDPTTQETIPCVPINEDGTTDIYAVTIAKDGFHGASLQGSKLIKTTLPNFKEAGAVKKGDVEMVAAVVLKNSKKAAVLRNIKIK